MQEKEIERLESALSATKDYLLGIKERDWAQLMEDGIQKIRNGDLSFVEPMYLKVAPTCEIEELFITEPERQIPPITEDEANSENNRFAELINELSNSLKPFWNRNHNQC